MDTPISPLGLASASCPSLREAIETCVSAKITSGRRPAYTTSLKGHLLSLFRAHLDTRLDAITTEDVERLALGRSPNRNTQGTYLRAVRILFDFAKRRRWVAYNPTDAVEPVAVPTPNPEILTVPQCRQLMSWCEGEGTEALAVIALGLFAGVRPDEISRVRWEDINLDGAELTVDAAASKTNRRRVVHLMPAAVAWLRMAHASGCRLPEVVWRRIHLTRLAKRALGLARWPADVLRHTAASYWFGLWRDVGKVAAELGHTPDVLMRHYRQLVTTEAAREFWDLLPTWKPPTAAPPATA